MSISTSQYANNNETSFWHLDQLFVEKDENEPIMDSLDLYNDDESFYNECKFAHTDSKPDNNYNSVILDDLTPTTGLTDDFDPSNYLRDG